MWRLLSTGYADGAMNMAIDDAVLTVHKVGKNQPTIRFYRWKPPCLSIGYAQSLRKEVNLARCKERGIDVVRRPTGGRAVLHDHELTYSLVARDDNPLVSGGIVESYRKISAGLLLGLRLLGADARAERCQGGPSPGRTAACFDSASYYEVTANGRKIVGSAQVRRQGIILQHGSLLLDVDCYQLFDLLNLPSDEERSRLAAELRGQVVALNEVLERPVPFTEVARAVAEGFASTFGVHLEPGELSPEEVKLARRLRAEKYTTEAWNFLR